MEHDPMIYERIEEFKKKFDRKNMILLGIFLLILAFVL